jgi:integrase
VSRDLTRPQRSQAHSYEIGDVIRFTRGSKKMALEKGGYASIEKIDRTVNYEIAALRGILKSKGFWGAVLDELERRGIKELPERHDVGRAISSADEQKLLDAIAASRSPALLPLFILAIYTGLRASELRSLTRRDLSLVWEKGTVQQGALTVPKSKTDAGTGRLAPLTSRACAVLSLCCLVFPMRSRAAMSFRAIGSALAATPASPTSGTSI